MPTLVKPLFSICTYGNWCDGYFAEIISHTTGRVRDTVGPYHRSDGRYWAYQHAEELANRDDLNLGGAFNPHKSGTD
jgi:hypothetical protein